jgi:hypothetical protein
MKFQNFKLKYLSLSITLLILVIVIYVFPMFVVSDSLLYSAFRGYEEEQGSLIAENFFQENIPHETFISDYNPLRPTYNILYTYAESESGMPTFNARVFYLERSGLFSYEVANQDRLIIRNKKYDEAKRVVLQNDFREENPDPENITVFEPIERTEPSAAQIRYDLCLEKIDNGEITTQEELLECNDLNNPID